MINTLEFLHCRAEMLDRMLENALPENAATLRAIKVGVELEIAVGVEVTSSSAMHHNWRF